MLSSVKIDQALRDRGKVRELGIRSRPRTKLIRLTIGVATAFIVAQSLGFAGRSSVSLGPATPAVAAQARGTGRHWIGTWGASPTPASPGGPHLLNQTLRLIVHTSVGGSELRVHLSNTFGAEPLKIGLAHVALRKSGSEIVPSSDVPLTFSGNPSIIIPAGAVVISDAARFALPPFADLAVSIFCPNEAPMATVHPMALQTSYVSPTGDFTSAAVLPDQSQTISSWPFLTGVSVAAPVGAKTVIALGDSITDGAASKSESNGRWPDVLARRLAGGRGAPVIGVINEGISGNRLLHDGALPQWPIFGQSTLTRFDRDVLAQPGAAEVIVLIGINDIGHPGAGAPPSEDVGAQDIIAGLKQLIERSHEHGLKILGCTLTPFEGTVFKGYFTPEKDLKRTAINDWIRNGKGFDGVVDFDKITRDPQHPARMLPAFDSGDHLHPNGAGLKAMGDAIDLSMLP